jgi:hypothetical protein
MVTHTKYIVFECKWKKENCYLEIVWLSLKAYFPSSSLWFDTNWQQKHTNSNYNISNCHLISFVQGLGPTHEHNNVWIYWLL